MSIFEVIFRLFLFSFLAFFSLFYAMMDTNVIDSNSENLMFFVFLIISLVFTALLTFLFMLDYAYLL